MSKLSIDQKTVLELLSDRKNSFLIPDYQRPYAWGEEQCQTLWDDIFQFAFPDNDKDKFDEENAEYFLGSIVTFKNKDGKLEVIDGQQRLTTLLLFLRAFYDKFGMMTDSDTLKTRTIIEKCIWKTDKYDTINKNLLKIESEVAMDDAKEEFISILKTGEILDSQKSNYAINYRFFKQKISELKEKTDGILADFAIRTVRNCILLPIEAENEESALRIFSTLNNRGLPLSDADIFKYHFYVFYSNRGEKNSFMKTWQGLEYEANRIFDQQSSPLDELFTLYMYYLRARIGTPGTTTQSLRDFYETNGNIKSGTKDYSIFNNPQTLIDLQSLINFWKKIKTQDKDYFAESTLKKLFVLEYSPNKMWSYILSVYFLVNKDENENLDTDKLDKFLTKITLFIMTYTVINPGVNQLRGPIFREMKNIIDNKEMNFRDNKITESSIEIFNNFDFWNGRPITKSFLAWWAFENPNQKLLSLDNTLQIEHIFSKKRSEIEGIKDDKLIELLGNKILLEKSINIAASDYHFQDKKSFYLGEKRRDDSNKPSEISEIQDIIELPDFREEQIIERNNNILNKFFTSLKEENILD